MTTKFLPVLVVALISFSGCGSDDWEKERSDPDLDTAPYAEAMSAWTSEPRTTGGIMMVGDSITYGWPECFLPATAKKRGICGDTTKGVLHRLWLVVEEAPDAIFLLIGVNNFVYGQIYEAPADVDAFIAEIEKKLPDTDLYLISILPTSETERPNHVIEQVNDSYQRICSEHPSCHYIDLFCRLYLPGIGLAQSEDGLHPNLYGYEVMAKAIAPYWDRYPAGSYPIIPLSAEN